MKRPPAKPAIVRDFWLGRTSESDKVGRDLGLLLTVVGGVGGGT